MLNTLCNHPLKITKLKNVTGVRAWGEGLQVSALATLAEDLGLLLSVVQDSTQPPASPAARSQWHLLGIMDTCTYT